MGALCGKVSIYSLLVPKHVPSQGQQLAFPDNFCSCARQNTRILGPTQNSPKHRATSAPSPPVYHILNQSAEAALWTRRPVPKLPETAAMPEACHKETELVRNSTVWPVLATVPFRALPWRPKSNRPPFLSAFAFPRLAFSYLRPPPPLDSLGPVA